MTELQSTLASVKSASSKFRAIQQKVETEWLVHQNLQCPDRSDLTVGRKSSTIATVMSEPMVAHKPAKPSKPLTVIFAGFFGSLLSLGMVTVDLFRRRPFVNRQQAEELLSIRSIAQIPAAESAANRDLLMNSELSNVFYSPEHRNARLIHVAAVSGQSGGQGVASCPASISAHHECPTLLINLLSANESNDLVSLTPQCSAKENLHTLTLTSDFLMSPESASKPRQVLR